MSLFSKDVAPLLPHMTGRQILEIESQIRMPPASVAVSATCHPAPLPLSALISSAAVERKRRLIVQPVGHTFNVFSGCDRSPTSLPPLQSHSSTAPLPSELGTADTSRVCRGVGG